MAQWRPGGGQCKSRRALTNRIKLLLQDLSVCDWPHSPPCVCPCPWWNPAESLATVRQTGSSHAQELAGTISLGRVAPGV